VSFRGKEDSSLPNKRPIAAPISTNVARRARAIRVLLVDVDGVMTDGHVWLLSQPDGSTLELKSFHSQDGAGLTILKLAGFRTGLITGRSSAAVTRRAAECGMDFVYQGVPVKIPIYEEILTRTGVHDAEVAYVGDDLPDIPVMKRVGLAVAVANAMPEVKRAAHYTTAHSGGNGAVREVVELLLKAQGRWEEMIDKARA
jgi:3-deoxy-D-manno-octulosonate 8-phosphate phosphatase (KDO 8-P phosphatase)